MKVTILVESFLEEFVRDETGAWKSIHSLHCSKIDGAIAINDIFDLVLKNYFLRDITNVETDVLGSFHGCVKLEVGYVQGHFWRFW